MAVESTDIELRYSTKSGSAGDSESGAPGTSLGKYMATTTIPDGVKGNLQPGISSAEAETGITKYQCLFVTHSSTSTWQGVRVWISSQKPGGAEMSIGLDPAGVVASDSSSPQAEEIADQYTAPEGVTFTAPTTPDDGLEAGDVEEGECFAVWCRWLVPPAAAAMNEDDAKIAVWGTSEP